MIDFLSSNIITRDQAYQAAMTDPVMFYGICVAALLGLCWFAKEWL